MVVPPGDSIQTDHSTVLNKTCCAPGPKNILGTRNNSYSFKKGIIQSVAILNNALWLELNKTQGIIILDISDMYCLNGYPIIESLGAQGNL